MKVLVIGRLCPDNPCIAAFTNTLVVGLQNHGHAAETLLLPFDPEAPLLEQAMAARLLDVSGSADRMVAINAPFHLVQHPHKILWLVEGLEMDGWVWDADSAAALRSSSDQAEFALLEHADRIAFAEARHVFCDPGAARSSFGSRYGRNADVLVPGPYLEAAGHPSGQTEQEIAVWNEIASQLTS